MMDDPGLQTLGFLSGPAEVLKAAQKSRLAQIELGTGESLLIKVLQVSASGLALISVIARRSPP
jgi:hypothetical protein